MSQLGRLPPNKLLDTGHWHGVTVAGSATITVDPKASLANVFHLE
jgi:hypothetical protein